jgi:hypothetical protein
MLLQILEVFTKIKQKAGDIRIDWYYDESDEQMYDDGMDLSGSVNLPFNFHTI